MPQRFTDPSDPQSVGVCIVACAKIPDNTLDASYLAGLVLSQLWRIQRAEPWAVSGELDLVSCEHYFSSFPGDF